MSEKISFWEKLKKNNEPILVLAPMADVTDVAFRKLIAKHSSHVRADGSVGGPDVMWTEFVSADGLARAPKEGREKLLMDLEYSEEERPIVAQLFSSTPEHMQKAARLCATLGFDGVDINMGCPDRSIEKQGCGAAMIKNPESARAIVRAAQDGARDIPVSVKTRLGYNKDELEVWLPELLKEKPAVVTVHARTRKEMSKVPARWERVAEAARIRDEYAPDTLIFGNGDVRDIGHARALSKEHGADGAMLGRAIFGNPWLFHPEKNADTIALEDRLAVLIEHITLFETMLPEKHFAIMKKHFKAYAHGFPGAKEFRVALMETSDANTAREVVHTFLKTASREILHSSATLYT